MLKGMGGGSGVAAGAAAAELAALNLSGGDEAAMKAIEQRISAVSVGHASDGLDRPVLACLLAFATAGRVALFGWRTASWAEQPCCARRILSAAGAG